MKENDELKWTKVIDIPEVPNLILNYEVVYLILHPFMLIPKHIDIYTEENRKIIKKIFNENVVKVSWNEILEKTGIKNKRALGYILHKYLQGRIAESNFSDFEGVHYNNEEIFDYLGNQNIYTPSEGSFPKFLENDFLNSFLDFGYKEAYICSEFLDEYELVNIKEQINDDYIITDRILCTPDERIAYGVYWDGYFTLLCSEKEIVKKIVKKYNFEGFYCTEKTTVEEWYEDTGLDLQV